MVSAFAILTPTIGSIVLAVWHCYYMIGDKQQFLWYCLGWYSSDLAEAVFSIYGASLHVFWYWWSMDDDFWQPWYWLSCVIAEACNAGSILTLWWWYYTDHDIWRQLRDWLICANAMLFTIGPVFQFHLFWTGIIVSMTISTCDCRWSTIAVLSAIVLFLPPSWSWYGIFEDKQKQWYYPKSHRVVIPARVSSSCISVLVFYKRVQLAAMVSPRVHYSSSFQVWVHLPRLGLLLLLERRRPAIGTGSEIHLGCTF